MFGIKMSKNGKHKSAIKESFDKGSEIVNEKLSESIKMAEEKMKIVKKYLAENQDDLYKVGKVSGFALLSLAGIGLLAYGVYSIMKE